MKSSKSKKHRRKSKHQLNRESTKDLPPLEYSNEGPQFKKRKTKKLLLERNIVEQAASMGISVKDFI